MNYHSLCQLGACSIFNRSLQDLLSLIITEYNYIIGGKSNFVLDRKRRSLIDE